MRLFIVDDSDILRSRIIESLSDIKGVSIVGEARNAREAIEAAEQLDPDAVILDIRLPGGNGISIIDAIRKLRKKQPKIIVFTNYPYLQYRKKCIDAGADYFFFKALEFERLIDLVRRLAKKYLSN